MSNRRKHRKEGFGGNFRQDSEEIRLCLLCGLKKKTNLVPIVRIQSKHAAGLFKTVSSSSSSFFSRVLY